MLGRSVLSARHIAHFHLVEYAFHLRRWPENMTPREGVHMPEPM